MNAGDAMIPQLGAVIPTIGRPEYFDISLGSLLRQHRKFHEIVVFDNSGTGSVRKSSSFAADPNIRWFEADVQLPAIESWNRCVDLCRSEYITIFGDDDFAAPEFASELVDAITHCPFVIAPFHVINERGDRLYDGHQLFSEISATDFRHLRMKGGLPLAVPGVAFPRSVFLELGGFLDAKLPRSLYVDDLLWFRMAQRIGRVRSTDNVPWSYRRHSSQIGTGYSLNDFQAGVEAFVDMLQEQLTALGADASNLFPNSWDAPRYKSDLMIKRFDELWRRSATSSDMFNERLRLLMQLGGGHLPAKFKLRAIADTARLEVLRVVRTRVLRDA